MAYEFGLAKIGKAQFRIRKAQERLFLDLERALGTLEACLQHVETVKWSDGTPDTVPTRYSALSEAKDPVKALESLRKAIVIPTPEPSEGEEDKNTAAPDQGVELAQVGTARANDSARNKRDSAEPRS